jgi:hypothetical protein
MNGATVLTKFTADTKDLNSKINNSKKELSGFAKNFAIGAGVVGTAYAAATGAVVSFTKDAVQSAGQLEQQIGGTEAVFGEFADTVQQKANESFSKMGTSANDYMQTINKMSSILQGSGYTVEDSMNTSSQVMQRAADVASVMGITVDEAMNAVTAAAKGNFTMMDNLGVAMNATTLEAYALSKGINKSYNSMSTAEKSGLAYQMFLEKTAKYAGNYEKENQTLAGSMQTLTSAWQNFLSGAGTTQDVINSVIGALDVITPMVVEIAPQLITGIFEIVNAILPQLPEMLKTMLPAIIEGVTLLITGIIEALPDLVLMIADMLPSLIPMLIDSIMAIIPALIDNLPLFINAGAKLIGGFIAGIVNLIPVLLARIGDIIVKIVNAFKKINLLDIGKNILKGLWNGIGSMKDWAINKIKSLGKSILDGLKSILGIKSPSKEFALVGKFSVLGYTEALDNMQRDVQKQVNETFGISPQLASSSALSYSPNVIVNNNINMRQDPLGQMVNDIKTFSGGSKNDYNYGMGV